MDLWRAEAEGPAARDVLLIRLLFQSGSSQGPRGEGARGGGLAATHRGGGSGTHPHTHLGLGGRSGGPETPRGRYPPTLLL